ncbi:Up in starvation [Cytospora paraplurivora]|uniref:Up in starvation n=1 Tax=Cytospora paraplurivora TaxID=2898453 RepID=A0AAN9UDC3_9PEZI
MVSRESAEMDVDESEDRDAAGGDDDAGSDGEDSVNADGSRSNKKKKSQRFYCTDYPPCNLSFTRSEHLARHIRRFSRLDNLRQHAQTVHVNEDIPIDSLAATGTRFQRQIRTDRVRQGTGRARASTAGSVGAPARGHSKSLSTSSITSVSSIGSNYSTRDDMRRRPPPLVMADPQARLSIESYRSAGSGHFQYRPASPSEYSTPTSATFSTGQSSPRWGSVVGSPATSYSRGHVMYASGSRTPGRRLSVPSGGNPFQSPHGAGGLGRPLFGPGSLNSSHNAALASPNGSLIGSPTMSTASGWSRRESAPNAADEAWRRRTWHPDSSNFANPGSRLSQVITSSQLEPTPEPLPAVSGHGPQQQNIRLPGIESFDPVPRRPTSPPRRIPSPMMIDSDSPNPPALLPSANICEERRNLPQWEMGLHRGLTRLEINSTTPPRDGAGAWANEVHQAMQARTEQQQQQPRPYQPTVRFEPEPQIVHPPPQSSIHAGPPRGHHHTMSAPSIPASRGGKRHGWYNGPVTVHEDRVLEGRPHVDRIAHPNLHAFTGFPAREQAPPQHHSQSANSDSLRRLEALVAVATSESSTATAC